MDFNSINDPGTFERNSSFFLRKKFVLFCILYKKEKKKKKTVTDTVGPKNIRPILDTHFIIRKIVYCRMEKQVDYMLIFSVYIYYLILITIV